MFGAFNKIKGIAIGVAATVLLVGPTAYFTGRAHEADAADAARLAALTNAMSAQNEIIERRAQLTARWEYEGYRVGLVRARQDQDETRRQTQLRTQAYEEASDTLRAEWSLADQLRLACVLDPACAPAGGDQQSPAPAANP